MNWFTPKCPVNDDDKAWLENSFLWLVEEFGADVLRDAPMILPTEEFFPERFSAERQDLQNLVNRVCAYMGVDPERIELQLFTDKNNLLKKGLPTFESSHSGAAGTYQERRGKYIISLETTQAANPTNLIATIAHELGHVRLLGENRLDADREDHEPLTDLATVFFGMGIFTANSAFVFQQWTDTYSQGWQAATHGYLSEEMFGYALASFAFLRGEDKPEWTKYLETNVQYYCKSGLKYLAKTENTKLKKL